MLKPTAKNMAYAALLISLLIVARIFRVVSADSVGKAARQIMTLLRGGIYAGIVIVWGFSVHRRIIQPKIRRLFTAIALFMTFWIIVRTVKFAPVDGYYPDFARYCWYLYYIPMLLIPTLAFMISMYLGRGEDYTLPAWAHGLLPAAAFLVLLVLTNDLHLLVFAPPAGASYFSDVNAVYEPLFYLLFAWRAAGLCVTVAVIFARSRVPRGGKRLFMPLVFAVFLLIYGILYVLKVPWVYWVFEDLTVTECMTVIALLESCLWCGLIQSNTHYEELFRVLADPTLIINEDGLPVYVSDSGRRLFGEQLGAARDAELTLPEGYLLKSIPIRGGQILWTENVAELMSIQSEAEATTKELEEEKDLLQAEIEMKRKQAVFDTRNRLYDSVSREIAPQFVEIERLVSASYQSEEERKTALRRMCVIGAYIKRRCNLLFISEEHQEISSEELVHCLRESADYIRLYGAQCTLNAAHSGMVPAQHAKTAYDLFERVVESVLPTLTAMLVYLDVTDAGLKLHIQSECWEGGAKIGDMKERINGMGGVLTSEREEGIEYVRLFFAGGGERL